MPVIPTITQRLYALSAIAIFTVIHFFPHTEKTVKTMYNPTLPIHQSLFIYQLLLLASR
ncbi:MAG: hypothetical protein HN848_03485 [Thiotrichales bacterium]|nr:hypothetical protein [Thiotrichales bacterium]MBT6617216.1 hypothetical protein [Thiotrichales bacterium]MBT7314557.1 hypothetical protein [Thiotrichales bacterium]